MISMDLSIRRVCTTIFCLSLVVGSAVVAPTSTADRAPFARGTASDLPLMSVKKSKNGVVLRPAQTNKLKVKVTNRQNRPLAGGQVVFVAPRSGPSGTFKGSEDDAPYLVRVRTNAKGIAKATFTAGETEGVCLVSALLVDEPAVSVSFGITVSAAPPTPGFAPEKARQAVLTELLYDPLEDETYRLHGPVLISSGATVATAGPGSTFFYPTEPVTVDRPSWLFWVDLNPTAAFAHPTRFIVVDATRAPADLSTEARVTDEGWWPTVTEPGAEVADDLVPPQFDADLFGVQTKANPLDLPKQGAPEDACAILLYGPDISGWIDTKNVARFLVDRGLVSADRIYALSDQLVPAYVLKTATRDDFRRLVMQAANDGCRKVYVYIVAHGYHRGAFEREGRPSSAYGGGFVLEKGPGERNGEVSYEEAIDILQPLQGRTLCYIQASCFSGQMSEWLQGSGFMGTFVSSANRDRVGYFSPGKGSHFTNALLECWRDEDADVDGLDGVTLAEATAWTIAMGGEFAVSGGPQLAPIDPNSFANHPLQDLYIGDPGEQGRLTIERPPGVPLNARYEVTVTIEDTTVAAFDGNGATFSGALPANQASGFIPVTGIEDGTTPVTLTGRNTFTGRSTSGRALIRVGGAYAVFPRRLMIDEREMGTVTLRQYSPLTELPGEFPICLTSDRPDRATPVLEMVTLPDGATELQIQIQGGNQFGLATIEVLDKRTGKRTSFQVFVNSV